MVGLLQTYFLFNLLFILIKCNLNDELLRVQKTDQKLIEKQRQDTRDMCKMFNSETHRTTLATKPLPLSKYAQRKKELKLKEKKEMLKNKKTRRFKRSLNDVNRGLNLEDELRVESVVDKIYDDLYEKGQKIAYRRKEIPTPKPKKRTQAKGHAASRKPSRRFPFAPHIMEGGLLSTPKIDDVIDDIAQPSKPVRFENAIMPYFIDAKTYDFHLAEIITRAFDYFEKATCVRLQRLRERPIDPESLHNVTWLYISNPSGIRQCVHSNDKVKIQGVQHITFGYDCMSLGDISHEIMHVLGFPHEHVRPDRDQHITILWENIKPGYKQYFEIQNISIPEGLPYDYASVMHYPPRAFSRNGKPTIVTERGVKIGQREALSEMDLEKISIAYSNACIRRNREYLLKTCPDVIRGEDPPSKASPQQIEKYFEKRLWPYGIVTYRYEPTSDFSSEEKENIKAVMDHISNQTCLQFVNLNETEGLDELDGGYLSGSDQFNTEERKHLVIFNSSKEILENDSESKDNNLSEYGSQENNDNNSASKNNNDNDSENIENPGKENDDNDSECTDNNDNDLEGKDSNENDSECTDNNDNDLEDKEKNNNDSESTDNNDNDSEYKDNDPDSIENPGNDLESKENSNNDSECTDNNDNDLEGKEKNDKDSECTDNDSENTQNPGNDLESKENSNNDSECTDNNDNDFEGKKKNDNDSECTGNDSENTQNPGNDLESKENSNNDSKCTDNNDNDFEGKEKNDNDSECTDNDSENTENPGNDLESKENNNNDSECTDNNDNDLEGKEKNDNDFESIQNHGSDNGSKPNEDNDSEAKENTENDSECEENNENGPEGKDNTVIYTEHLKAGPLFTSQYLDTISKESDSTGYRFKINPKKFGVSRTAKKFVKVNGNDAPKANFVKRNNSKFNMKGKYVYNGTNRNGTKKRNVGVINKYKKIGARRKPIKVNKKPKKTISSRKPIDFRRSWAMPQTRRHSGAVLLLKRSEKPGCPCPPAGKPQDNGNLRELIIHTDCFNTANDLLHVFGHVLGLDHQHNMHDRDKYLHIVWENLTPDVKKELEVKLDPAASAGYPYDYRSVMHYPWLQIKNGKTNIMYPIWNDGWVMGHWQGLSAIDVEKIQRIYHKSCENRKQLQPEKEVKDKSKEDEKDKQKSEEDKPKYFRRIRTKKYR